MRKIILTTTALVSLSAAAFAVAGGAEVANPGPMGGMYIGVGAGWGAMQTPSSMLTETQTELQAAALMKQQRTDFAARVDAGYLFKVANNFFIGPEVGYTYLPETKYTYVSAHYANNEAKLTNYAFDLLAVAKVYLNDSVNLFAKVGATYVIQDASYSNSVTTDLAQPAFSQSKKVNKFLPEVAVGAGYNITPALEATVTYTHAFGASDNSVQESKLFPLTYVGGVLQKGNFGHNVPSYNTVLVGMDYSFNT